MLLPGRELGQERALCMNACVCVCVHLGRRDAVLDFADMYFAIN